MSSDEACPPPLAPLPGPVHRETTSFHRCLIELIRLIGVHLPDVRVDDPAEPRQQHLRGLGVPEHDLMRSSVRRALGDRRQLPEPLFDGLLRAAVYDPDPSSDRQIVEPAIAAFSRRRVQEAVLRYLTTGTNPERAGAARVWYWADVELDYRGAELIATPESRAEYDAHADLRMRWNEAALREFVANDDLDVRRCVLPVLPLHPVAHPEESHGLVTKAVRIARTHPDDYIRQRVEIQVAWGDDLV